MQVEYPKKVMRLRALVSMGFSEMALLKIAATNGQKLAWKNDPLKSNSPLLFDTDELEKWRIKQAKTTTQSIRGLAGK